MTYAFLALGASYVILACLHSQGLEDVARAVWIRIHTAALASVGGLYILIAWLEWAH